MDLTNDDHRSTRRLAAGLAVLPMLALGPQAAAATTTAGTACDLQGQYLIFFGPGVSDPVNGITQPKGMALRASALVAGIADGWQHNRSPLLIAGHVDAQELKSSAPDFAQSRADAVRHALVKAGVDPDALWVRADGMHGAMLPDASGSEIQNRFVIVKAPQVTSDCAYTATR